MADAPEGSFEADLQALGFVPQAGRRTAALLWRLAVNRYLEIVLHDEVDHVVLTWSFAFGEFAEDRGWVAGTGETSFHAIFPRVDVRLETEIEAVEAEIRRTLATLRVDLGDPGL